MKYNKGENVVSSSPGGEELGGGFVGEETIKTQTKNTLATATVSFLKKGWGR